MPMIDLSNDEHVAITAQVDGRRQVPAVATARADEVGAGEARFGVGAEAVTGAGAAARGAGAHPWRPAGGALNLGGLSSHARAKFRVTRCRTQSNYSSLEAQRRLDCGARISGIDPRATNRRPSRHGAISIRVTTDWKLR
jgi:hypothetical protein